MAGSAQPPGDGLVLRCAWCGRVRVDRDWVVPDQVPEATTMTHGICPDCAERLSPRDARA